MESIYFYKIKIDIEINFQPFIFVIFQNNIKIKNYFHIIIIYMIIKKTQN